MELISPISCNTYVRYLKLSGVSLYVFVMKVINKLKEIYLIRQCLILNIQHAT